MQQRRNGNLVPLGTLESSPRSSLDRSQQPSTSSTRPSQFRRASPAQRAHTPDSRVIGWPAPQSGYGPGPRLIAGEHQQRAGILPSPSPTPPDRLKAEGCQELLLTIPENLWKLSSTPFQLEVGIGYS